MNDSLDHKRGLNIPAPGDEGLFIGRNQDLARLLEWAKDKPSAKLMILEGNAGVGKTSLLRRFASVAFDNGLTFLIVDVSQLSSASSTEFIWGFTKELNSRLTEFGLKAPPFEKRLLVLRPWQSFRKYYWPELLSRYGDNLIIALDNFDQLVIEETNNENLPFFRSHLKRLFDIHGSIKGLIVLRGRNEAYSQEQLQPFDSLTSHRISRLTKKESSELIRRGSQLLIFQDLVSIIFELSGGHPGDIKIMLLALQKRAQTLAVNQITLADLLMVLDHELAPKNFYTNVYARLDKLQYTYKTDRQ